MSNYYKFSKKQFEWELRGILSQVGGKMEDITEEWINEGNISWEIIYKISTKNRSVDIIIFSSIDKDTKHVREIGADAVRVVLRWKTRKGNLFKALHTHYRLKTLFNNLKGTLQKAHSQVFELKGDEFSQEVG